MFRTLGNHFPKKVTALGLTAGLLCTSSIIEGVNNTQPVNATPSLLEFRWDGVRSYRKLYYYQTSKIPRDKAKYFFVLRPRDRKTAILKLTITVPEHFKANIKPKNLKLCKMEPGGMLKKNKCIQTIPAVFEVSEDQKAIDVFPDRPVSIDDTVAVILKLFNPSKRGMFQFNALIQAPGEVPMAGYVGSWNISLE